MIANVNEKTGIRYGVISMNNLDGDIWDVFVINGTNLTWEAFKTEHPNWEEDEQAELIEYSAEEECYEAEVDGMKLGLSWLGGAPFVWVYESPHTTHARECSPCVPHAGDLDSKDPGGFECYDLPVDWYDSRQA